MFWSNIPKYFMFTLLIKYSELANQYISQNWTSYCYHPQSQQSWMTNLCLFISQVITQAETSLIYKEEICYAMYIPIS